VVGVLNSVISLSRERDEEEGEGGGGGGEKDGRLGDEEG
jgi:hypothetical protein